MVESSMTACRRSLLSSATSAYRRNKSIQPRVFASSLPLGCASKTPTGFEPRPRTQVVPSPFALGFLPCRIRSTRLASAGASSPLSCHTTGVPFTTRHNRAPSNLPGAASTQTIWAASSPGSVSGFSVATTCSSVSSGSPSCAGVEGVRGAAFRVMRGCPCTRCTES